MFDDLLESTNQKKKTNKGWSVILSGLVQTVILGILVLIHRQSNKTDIDEINLLNG